MKDEKQYLIKWKRKDYGKLIKAVNQYNKRINELNALDLDISLPNKPLVYKDIKEEIVTRKQLNQILSTLKRINFKSAIDKIVLESGEAISKWEYYDVMKKKEIAETYLRKQIEEELSNLTYKGLKNERIEKLEATLRTIENFQNKKGDSLRYALDRIKKVGSIDYEIKKASTFKENFMYALKEASSNFSNYKILKNKLDTIKNPKEFYEFVSQSETLMDLFIWYDDETGTLQYGGFKSNEDAFNDAIVKLGFDIEV